MSLSTEPPIFDSPTLQRNGESQQKQIEKIEEMPEELIFYIFTFLEMKDLGTAAQVNKLFLSIVDNCKLILTGNAKGDTWKEQYLWVAEAKIHKDRKLVASSVAISLFNKGKQRKALRGLIKEGNLENNPKAIVAFIKNPGTKPLSRRAIGDYLCKKENSEVLEEYLKTFDFTGLDIVDGLRLLILYLELPVVQKIGHLMESFGKHYYKQNPDVHFAGPASVSNLGFSIYLIWYSPSSMKRKIPLPLKKFVDNNKGINGGKDFSMEYLENVYDRAIHSGLTIDDEKKFFPVVRAGWLNKQGMDLLKMWKKRWFLLCQRTLWYFKKPGDPVIGSISLENILIMRVKGKKTTFKLSSAIGNIIKSGKNHSQTEVCFLSADTEEESESWVNHIIDCSHEGSVFQEGNQISKKEQKAILKNAKMKGKQDEKKKKPVEQDSKAQFPNNPEDHHEPTPYFGVPLETILEREGRTVPFFVERAMEYIGVTSLEEEGILRVSGSISEINKLREEVEAGKNIDNLFDGSIKWDPNAVAGLLKSFFRELPEPLFSKELNDKATLLLSFGDGSDVLEDIRGIVQSLSPANFELFKLLVYFLMQVVAHADKNKMNLNNLLRVMTPTVHCVPGLVSIAMDNYDFIFYQDIETPSENSTNFSPDHSKESSFFSSDSKVEQNGAEPQQSPEKRKSQEDSVIEEESSTNSPDKIE